jgi:hypothetical protein
VLKAIALIALAAIGLPAQPRLSTQGKAFCSDVERTISTLTTTGAARCFPTQGNTPRSLSVIVVFATSCLDNGTKQRACLIMAAGVVGNAMRENPDTRVDQVVVADIASAKARYGYRFAASLAKSLQTRMSSSQIGLAAAYTELQAAMTRYTVSAGIN